MDDTNADKKEKVCTCELCQPNWHLGMDGDFSAEQPNQRPVEQDDLTWSTPVTLAAS